MQEVKKTLHILSIVRRNRINNIWKQIVHLSEAKMLVSVV